ncbi:MAG TPA: dihydrofolate reductase family protein [Candidatus Limnocylindria bacterium]|nr:dihydrofolate reductase family protein [Candidatus Limnocylindria bacterium]
MTADFRVDRLWPDPAPDLDLDAAYADRRLPEPPVGRPWVGVNMVTSIDGRAQLSGTADGLAGRADRRLMRLLRLPYDAVASGAGTLRTDGNVWLRVPADLAARRVQRGLPPQPTTIVIAGSSPVPLDAGWLRGDEPRVLVVGSDSPHAGDGAAPLPPGTELLVAPTPRPAVTWLLDRLAARGIRSVLFEGGPTTNAVLLAADAIDELHWTIGPILLGTDALGMIAAIPGGSPWALQPRRGRLASVHRHADELFVTYRFG